MKEKVVLCDGYDNFRRIFSLIHVYRGNPTRIRSDVGSEQRPHVGIFLVVHGLFVVLVVKRRKMRQKIFIGDVHLYVVDG